MPRVIDVPGVGVLEFPDGMSDDAVRSAIHQRMGQQPQTERVPFDSRRRAQIEAGRAAAEQEALQAGADQSRAMLNMLPEVAGTIGSLLGPLGAGLAGAGEAAKQVGLAAVGEGFDRRAVENATLLGLAGGRLGEYGGQALAKGAGMLAKSQMAKALRPAAGLVRDFPTVVGDALKQGAKVGSILGERGSVAADRIRQEATGHTMRLLRAATNRGQTIQMEEIARPVMETVERKLGRALTQSEGADIVSMVRQRSDELLNASIMGMAKRRAGSAIKPLLADELRQAAARHAQATLRQEASGLPTTAIPDLDRLISKGTSRAVKMLPGVAKARAAEQTAIGVSRAVRAAENRPIPAEVGLALGPLKAGIGLPPEIASRLALLANGLNTPGLAQILAQLGGAGGSVAGGQF